MIRLVGASTVNKFIICFTSESYRDVSHEGDVTSIAFVDVKGEYVYAERPFANAQPCGDECIFWRKLAFDFFNNNAWLKMQSVWLQILRTSLIIVLLSGEIVERVFPESYVFSKLSIGKDHTWAVSIGIYINGVDEVTQAHRRSMVGWSIILPGFA